MQNTQDGKKGREEKQRNMQCPLLQRNPLPKCEFQKQSPTFGAEKGDPRFYTGPTWTAPVTHAYWWTIKLKSFRVGTHELVSDGGNLVVDTGTTNFAAPSDMRPQILQASKGGSNGEYLPWHFEIYCDAPASGYEAAVPGGKQPNTHNYCDGSSKTFTLTFQPDDYLIGRSDGKKRVALQAIDLQNRAMFFGAHSLRKFYSVYAFCNNYYQLIISKFNFRR